MIKNTFEVKAKGLNQEKFINNIKSKITLYKVERENYNSISITVSIKNKKYLLKQLEKYNYKIEHQKSKGILHSFKNLFFRFGLTFGIIISLIVLGISNLYVFKTQIDGTETISVADVQQALVEYGVNNFAAKNKIKTQNIEDMLKTKFDKISLVSAIIKGQTLIVNIKEKVTNDNMDSYLPIVSLYDAKITKLHLIQGTSAVKVGQIVKKGDLLVHPYIIDSSGQKRNLKPDAEIEGDVWIEEKVTHYDKKIELQRTGKSHQTNELSIGKIVLNKKGENIFEKYEMEIKENFIAKNNILPIKITKVFYYEVEETKIDYPFETNKNEILAQIKQNVLQKMLINEIIKQEYHTIDSGGGISQISYVLVVSRDLINEN